MVTNNKPVAGSVLRDVAERTARRAAELGIDVEGAAVQAVVLVRTGPLLGQVLLPEFRHALLPSDREAIDRFQDVFLKRGGGISALVEEFSGEVE